jgi:hypothetical protein
MNHPLFTPNGGVKAEEAAAFDIPIVDAKPRHLEMKAFDRLPPSIRHRLAWEAPIDVDAFTVWKTYRKNYHRQRKAMLASGYEAGLASHLADMMAERATDGYVTLLVETGQRMWRRSAWDAIRAPVVPLADRTVAQSWPQTAWSRPRVPRLSPHRRRA